MQSEEKPRLMGPFDFNTLGQHSSNRRQVVDENAINVVFEKIGSGKVSHEQGALMINSIVFPDQSNGAQKTNERSDTTSKTKSFLEADLFLSKALDAGLSYEDTVEAANKFHEQYSFINIDNFYKRQLEIVYGPITCGTLLALADDLAKAGDQEQKNQFKNGPYQFLFNNLPGLLGQLFEQECQRKSPRNKKWCWLDVTKMNGLIVHDQDFSDSDFRCARMAGIQFLRTDLRSSDFSYVEGLENVVLTGSKLEGAKLKGTSLEHWHKEFLKHCIYQGSQSNVDIFLNIMALYSNYSIFEHGNLHHQQVVAIYVNNLKNFIQYRHRSQHSELGQQDISIENLLFGLKIVMFLESTVRRISKQGTLMHHLSWAVQCMKKEATTQEEARATIDSVFSPLRAVRYREEGLFLVLKVLDEYAHCSWLKQIFSNRHHQAMVSKFIEHLIFSNPWDFVYSSSKEEIIKKCIIDLLADIYCDQLSLNEHMKIEEMTINPEGALKKCLMRLIKVLDVTSLHHKDPKDPEEIFKELNSSAKSIVAGRKNSLPSIVVPSSKEFTNRGSDRSSKAPVELVPVTPLSKNSNNVFHHKPEKDKNKNEQILHEFSSSIPQM